MITICGALYFSEVQDFTDFEVGLIIATLGVLAGVYTILFSSIPDRLGVKIAMQVSNGCGFVGFLGIIFITDRYLQLIVVLTVLIIPLILSAPTVKLGIKKYTSYSARALAYSVYCIIYYSGVAIAGLVVDIVLSSGDDDEQSSYTIIFIISAVLMGSAFIASFYLRNLEFSLRGDEEIQVKQPENSSWEHMRSILVLKSFWRLVCLSLLMAMVKSVFTHITLTLPLYMERDIEDGAHYGLIIAFNQVILIIATIMFTLFIYITDNFTLLTYASFITSAAPLVFLFGASYLTVIVFVFFVAIGEGIHTPRLIDYCIEIAPKGREGVFLAIAASPLALGNIVSGLTAGLLLETYCPEDGERECWKIWIYISGISFVAAFTIFFFRRCLEQPIFESHPYVSWSKEAKEDKRLIDR